ncbi:MAG: hypothetical protein JWM82_3128 [Myxococcales bacterium]|nr:hypothetical protein [Myxococcales bacterium]
MQLPTQLKGRKLAFGTLALTFLLVTGWTMHPDKISPIALGIVGIYSIFVTGHSLTDIKANPPAKTTTEGEGA